MKKSTTSGINLGDNQGRPPEVKPARAGVYNASKRRDPKVFRYWDALVWGFSALNANEAVNVRRRKTHDQHRIRWRGLAEQPK